jgi:Tfp pilus assembly protein PilV
MQSSISQRGFFLIEVVVAASIISVVLILLIGSIQNSVEVSQRSLERTQASYLLEEGAEAIKAIRDNAWTNISSITPGTTYYLNWNGTTWVTTTTPQTIDIFTRTFTVSDVSRDANADIVTGSGTVDAGTKKITIVVSWVTPSGTKTEDLSFYVSDIRS